MTTLVRLYPRAWRDRYEAEFLGILEARPPSRRDRLDIVRGAFDARLHPEVPGSPDGPRLGLQPVRLLGVVAVVAGLAWLTWVVAILGDVRWLESGASVYSDVVTVSTRVAFLSLAIVHASLAMLNAGRSARQIFSFAAASIAVVFLVMSGIGFWWTPVLALPASAVFAIAISDRVIPASLAGTWAATALLALGVFLGGVGAAFGALSVVVGGVPFGVVWVFVGAMFVARGLPTRATVPDRAG
jgi:hypothetical protein